MISDPTFWFLIAFVTFLSLIGKSAWKLSTTALDDRSAAIQNDINAAIQAREKAENLLNSVEQQHQHAAEHSKNIIEHARKEADRLKAEAEKEIAEFTKRREEQVNERIQIIEDMALTQIKAQAIEAGVKTATNILSKKIDDQTDEAIMKSAIAGLKMQEFKSN